MNWKRLTWAIGAAAALAVGGWAARYLSADPLELLPAPGRATVAAEAPSPRAAELPHRRVTNLRLDGGAAGDIRISLSLPREISGEKLPVFVLLGGLRTGRGSIFHVKAPGGNALVGFQYPLPKRIDAGWAAVPRLPALRRQAVVTPAQVVSVLAWLRTRHWADPDRISLVGVSLGALYLPAVQNLAQRHGVGARHLVIAYGAAGIGGLVAGRLRFGPAWVRDAVGWVAGFLLRPVEPALHLPALRGDVLLVNSAGPDRFLPPEGVRALHRLAPEPKTVVELTGGHYGDERGRLARRLVEVAETWLRERNAMNP